MGICRIIGLVGSALVFALLGALIFIGDRFNGSLFDWLMVLTFSTVGFNFIPTSKFNESLIGLWIESKKAKLRKQIKQIEEGK